AGHMLYPPVRTCDRTYCSNPKLLRHKDNPVSVTLFTLSEGVCDAVSVHLYCYACQTNYHHEFAVHKGIRSYYSGFPSAVQVSEHKFIERSVLQHFMTLHLLSWTSATNAAHIYEKSLSKLDETQLALPRYRLRTEHVWTGFIVNSLLKDA
ncbi:hypothetical protein K466DRAFT_440648, partial [Polyporus arcularius HHB13444]